jgi:bifunctional N-acetylglucosamine-1-phosphate-uridyltransferase/glucosamine-1-phosphate-acetyltransferase GlmU-like protein
VEDKNRREEDGEATEVFSSHFIFKADCLYALLDELEPEFEKRPFFLTDILEIFFSKDFKVETLAIGEYEELADLNTPADLVWAEEILNKRKFSRKTKTERKTSGSKVIN